MARSRKPEGVTLVYQGKTCEALTFEYTRPTGLEPGFGFVHMLRSEFQDFTVKESIPGVDTLAGIVVKPKTTSTGSTGGTREKAPAQAARPKTQEKPAGRGLLSVGSLEFTEVVNGVEHQVVIDQVLVTERAVEQAIVQDDDPVCRVELTDPRYLYKTRGAPITLWVNVPKRKEADESQASASPGAGGTVEAGGAPGSATEFVLGSLKGTRPWRLRELLEEKVLPALPFSPRLKYISPKLADAEPKGHAWIGSLPIRVLADLRAEFEFVFALNRDGSVSIWERGEGELEVEGKRVIFDPNHPSVDERVSNSRELVAYKHVPACVVVLGGPVYRTEKLRLEPVGEIGGKLVPLPAALEAIGLNLVTARRYALLPDHRRATLPVTDAGAEEFDRWAFKYWRLPGGTEQHSDKLPLLPGRAAVDSVGAFLPNKVFSESHVVVNRIEAMLAVEALVQASSGIGVQGNINTASGQEALEARRKLETALLRKAAKISSEHYRVSVDLPFSLQASGYRIDLDRGLVIFNKPQGLLAKEGCSPDEAELGENLARVELEFGYLQRPSHASQLSLDLRYHSVWARTTKDGKTSVVQIESVPAFVAPIIKERPDLELVITLEGESNRSVLDASARKTAEDVFKVEQSTQGAVVEFCRPCGVETNGRVLSVTWATVPEVPRVTAHIGTFPPLSQEGQRDLRTRAFGPQVPSALQGSVFTPKNLGTGSG